MKKLLVITLVLAIVLSLAACEKTEDPSKKSEGVMTYAQYAAAALDSEVTVETYVQAKQSWWEKEGVGGVGTFYTQDSEGGYFLYEMPCSKENYDPHNLVKATIAALTEMRDAYTVAGLRGIPMSKVFNG